MEKSAYLANLNLKEGFLMSEKLLPNEIEDLLKNGDIEELKRVFSQCDPNAVTYTSSNIFSLSPMPREFAIWAKEQGADINHRDDFGRTPIFHIVRMDGNVSMLIKLGAKVDVVCDDGFTPLHIAATRGKKKAMRALLKAGADIEAQTKDYDGFGHFTPLEIVLYKSDLSCIKKYDLCKCLLENGAKITERSRQFLSAFSETFHRHNLGKKITKSLQNQAGALEKLCNLFNAEMLRETSFHDGVSPIILTTVGGFKNNFAELWDFLVPSKGRAQTAQGEVIRIAGKIERELMRNGGLNWDEEYQNMLHTFRAYMCLGNPLGESDEYVDEIIDTLMDGSVHDYMIWSLCYCARKWVQENPEVMPLLEAKYTR